MTPIAHWRIPLSAVSLALVCGCSADQELDADIVNTWRLVLLVGPDGTQYDYPYDYYYEEFACTVREGETMEFREDMTVVWTSYTDDICADPQDEDDRHTDTVGTYTRISDGEYSLSFAIVGDTYDFPCQIEEETLTCTQAVETREFELEDE